MKSPNSSNKENDLNCLACGGSEQRWAGNKNQLELWKCMCCGMIFMRQQVAAEALEELYDHYYDSARFETPPVVAQSLARQIASFASYRVAGRILDIGFGEGGLLRIAEQQGWQCYGTEVSPQALAYGATRGWQVTNNADRDSRFSPHSFDVVTMIELLEHMPNPQQVLAEAARWLRPGGLLYLTTPNAKSLNCRLLGLNWSVVSPPEHIALWTAQGIKRAFSKVGLQPLRIRTEGLNPYEMLARWRTPQATFNRNETGAALNQTFSSSPLRRALKTSINLVLSAAQIGDSLKVYATRAA
jgi:2-polyprenyl-3-methyl-5-hydroxy-6-metoxy-1,4-benzoquinol methylase